MCGRYVLKREDLEALVKLFGLRSLEEWHSRFNIAPTSIVPLIRTDPAGTAQLAGVRWGLIPAWAKPDAPAKPLVNLRAETLVTKFRGALKSRRCILPASGFYEWQAVGPRKQPWYFSAPGGQPFGFAGVWDTWKHGGTELETCTILTTTPNAVLHPIHNRMPVILNPDQCRTWLDRATPPEQLQQLLSPAADDAIAAARVSPAVSNVRNDGPECIASIIDEPPPAEESPQLDLGL